MIFSKRLTGRFSLSWSNDTFARGNSSCYSVTLLRSIFRELDTEEIQKVAKNAAEKVEMQIGENGIEMIGMYARNGREAINLVQISAGMAINEERSFIKDEDIEWVVHSSQLTPKYEKRIYPIPGLVL